MLGGWSGSLSNTTTRSGSTAPWATWRPRTGWKAGTWKSTRPATGNWRRPGNSVGCDANKPSSSPEAGLGKKPKRGKALLVGPEDRALLGSNPSAAADSYTAGLGGLRRPGRPPAGTNPKRKIPGVRGQSPRVLI